MMRFNKRSGFTLIELLVYTAVFVVAAGLLTGILVSISGGQSRENAVFEVTRQLQFVTQKIQYSVRDASSIANIYETNATNDTSIPCANYCSLKLRVNNQTLDPTVFSSDANGVYITEGSKPRVLLTTPSVKVSSLKFTSVANPGGLSTVTIDLNLAFNSNESRLAVTKRLTSAIAHVSAATFDSDLLPNATDTISIGNSTSRWKDLTVTNNLAINNASASAGDSIIFNSVRGATDATTNGATYGLTSFNQYYNTATPYNLFGLHLNVGTTPVLYLEGDFSQTTRRAYFLNSNVGIGTATPLIPLQVGSNAGIYNDGNSAMFSRNLYYSSGWKYIANGYGNGVLASSIGDLHFYVAPTGTAGSAATLTDALTVLNNGFVGVGATSPAYRLDVSGDLRITGTPYRAGGDIAWQVPSDLRLKNISGNYNRGLKEILALNPVRYRFKPDNPVGADSSQEYIGIIAQEARKVIPEAVSEGKNGYLSLNSSPIFWTIVNSIKDLASEDASMKKTIETQKATINDLTRRLEILESKQGK